ncbi:hypothetical protein [Acidiferrobacter sp.]|jgi:hypothetical protein|uniref:hypothetical protein n=1 Tax=Acidiferrobacter sp. TaxID=1872107 RepID=UPI0026105099|nr:hypothetical protein [Acidiferrobacter sp.]
MMGKWLWRQGAGVMAMLAGGAMAAAYAQPVNISVGASTLGLGVQISTALIPGTLDLAVGINHLSESRSGTYTSSNNSIPYHATLRLQTIPVLLNYYPFAGVFRITGGAMVNENRVSAYSFDPNGTYVINGEPYPGTAVGTFTGTMTYRRIAPYLGIGWGSKAARHSGFSMGFDVGVLFTGSPQVQLSASNPTDNATLASDVAAAQASANARASSYKLWPVIGLRLGYAF